MSQWVIWITFLWKDISNNTDFIKEVYMTLTCLSSSSGLNMLSSESLQSVSVVVVLLLLLFFAPEAENLNDAFKGKIQNIWTDVQSLQLSDSEVFYSLNPVRVQMMSVYIMWCDVMDRDPRGLFCVKHAAWHHVTN